MWTLPARILTNPEIEQSNDGQAFVFHPITSFGCVAVLGKTRFSENAIHSFAVEFYPPYFGEARAVGVGTKQALLHFKNRMDHYATLNTYESLVGLDENSWGLNYDGFVIHKKARKPYFDKSLYNPDSPLQVKVTYDTCSNTLSFHVNDKNLGVAFENIDRPVYPMICSSGRDTHAKLLWHRSHIGTLQCICRSVIRANVRSGYLEKLPLPTHVIAFLNYK